MLRLKVGRKTSRGIVVKGGKVLLFERWRTDETGAKLHYYSIPGGHIEKNEIPEATVVRELFEETGVLVRPVKLVAKQKQKSGDEHAYYFCEYLSGKAVIRVTESEPQTKDNRSEPRWIDKPQLAKIELKDMYRPLRQLIVDALKGKLPEKPLQLK